MRKNKIKRGRPPKSDAERRDSVVYIKVTVAEKASINEAGQPEPTAWARDVLLRAAKRGRKTVVLKFTP